MEIGVSQVVGDTTEEKGEQNRGP